MNKGTVISLILALALGAVAEPKKPNFVVIFTDDLEFVNLGYYRNTKMGSRWLKPGITPPVHTPHLDKLFHEGMVFSRAYVPSPVCTPSRFCMLTGKYASRSAEFNRSEQVHIGWSPWLRKDELTFPKVLQKNGYTTGLVGKWMVGGSHNELWPNTLNPKDNPRDPDVKRKLLENYLSAQKTVKRLGGFDVVDRLYASNINYVRIRELDAHNQEWVTEGALEFVEQNKDNPFMLYLATTTPHGPNSLDSIDADPRITPLGYLDEAPNVQPSRESVKKRALKGWTDRVAKKASSTHPEWAKGNAVASTWIDDSVGAVLEKLDELGLDENTVVIFTSDHQWRGKLALYESAHVPFAVRWPGKIKSGVECDALVSTLDIAPTLFEMAGIQPPASMPLDGMSFLPLLKGETPSGWRDSLYLEITTTRAVVSDDGFKYIAWRLPPDLLKLKGEGKVLSHFGLWVDDPQYKKWSIADRPPRYRVGVDFPFYYDVDQLYDLKRDPNEQVNLAKNPEYAALLQKMKKKLKGYSNDLPHAFGEFKQKK
ncbi:sulfatase family protein [Pontiella sulfatireligans]|uniref:Arylsulfatase n=1 Tax=Pontiella sulfatireligans TaxID=2750658 RepID=A0A6C2UJQ5_9BACT|nr:sulfatase-like hydrolase/transferase [Pontiella sulfatireligans]SPS74349.1 sulfatase S1_51 [Kiritimatiellales bacterium]VGO19544.1 Arylsulfatase [Pontiella sulfatireligans]